MIFQHTWPQVLSGQKTQTRRIVKDGDMVMTSDWETSITGVATINTGRIKYHVDKGYAVQPGRGKKSIGRIEIVHIDREDVRHISIESIDREGVRDYLEFMRLWVSMHDKDLHKSETWQLLQSTRKLTADTVRNLCRDTLYTRPAHLYDAWVLHFELIEDYTKGEQS